MISVLATIKVGGGRRDEVLAIFKELVPKVRAEEGCVEYGPWLDTPNDIVDPPQIRDDVIMVVEKWESLEALKAHINTPHTQEFLKTIEDMDVEVSLQILQPA